MRRVVAYVDDVGNCFPTNDHTHGCSILCSPELYKDEEFTLLDPDDIATLLKCGATCEGIIQMKEAGII